tara:strand:- start:17 stop:163 length:147 start_codon:yes stop_codon:yes gene_type:complete
MKPSNTSLLAEAVEAVVVMPQNILVLAVVPEHIEKDQHQSITLHQVLQ